MTLGRAVRLLATAAAYLGLVMVGMFVAEIAASQCAHSSHHAAQTWLRDLGMAVSLWVVFPVAALLIASTRWSAAPRMVCTGVGASLLLIMVIDGEQSIVGYANLVAMVAAVYAAASFADRSRPPTPTRCACGYLWMRDQVRCPECGRLRTEHVHRPGVLRIAGLAGVTLRRRSIMMLAGLAVVLAIAGAVVVRFATDNAWYHVRQLEFILANHTRYEPSWVDRFDGIHDSWSKRNHHLRRLVELGAVQHMTFTFTHVPYTHETSRRIWSAANAQFPGAISFSAAYFHNTDAGYGTTPYELKVWDTPGEMARWQAFFELHNRAPDLPE